jgi:hypothetical protein
MKKITSLPILLSIVVLFSIIGYLAAPNNRYDLMKPKLEWAISFGLIGLSLALSLYCTRLLPPKPRSFYRPFAFLGLELISAGLIMAIYRGLSAINFGGNFGNLFYGDSGFSIFGVLGGSAFSLISVFIYYLVWHVFVQTAADRSSGVQ